MHLWNLLRFIQSFRYSQSSCFSLQIFPSWEICITLVLYLPKRQERVLSLLMILNHLFAVSLVVYLKDQSLGHFYFLFILTIYVMFWTYCQRYYLLMTQQFFILIKTLMKWLYQELIEISDWFNCNKLSLNIKETCFLRYPARNVDQSFNTLKYDTTIDRVLSTWFLGVQLEESLSWKK